MATLFLLLIYLSFISLGLPDSLLGSAWPLMQVELGASLDAAGLVSMVVTFGTIVSSLLSNWLTSRFGTGRVTAVSVSMTALALLGFSFAPGFWALLLLGIPLGLGAGAVDAALNNYVALHYSARHMSWLHCFWGLGAFGGPMIVSAFLAQNNWRGGYRTISIIQIGISLLLFLSLPMWKKREANGTAGKEEKAQAESAPPAKNALLVRGVPLALITFLLYCGLELCVSLWGPSYLIGIHGASEALAARLTSFYFIGITAGRFVTGVFANRFSGPVLIRIGIVTLGLGALLLLLPLSLPFAAVGIALLGIGSAPIYPAMIHETPRRFGAQNSQKVVGLQMAFAYIGSTLVPPALGFVAARTSIGVLPYMLLGFAALMLLCSEWLNQTTKQNYA